MALDDEHRITKDTSARKNTTTPGTVSVLEVTAIRASYDAYITSIKAGHEGIIDGLQSEHAEEVSALKNEAAIAITAAKAELTHERHTVAAKQEAAAAEASRKAERQSADLTQALRAKISDLEKDNEVLQTSLKGSLDKNRTNIASASQLKNRLEGQLQNLKKAHANELRDMEAKLAVGPNSWIQLCLRRKNRPKVRTYFLRYTALLKEVAKELRKELGDPASYEYVFRRQGGVTENGTAYNMDQTLQENGIKDGEEIWFESVLVRK